MKLKLPGQIALFIVVIGLAFGGYRLMTGGGGGLGSLIPSAKTKGSTVPPRADLPPEPGTPGYKPVNVDLPGSEVAHVGGAEVRMLIWAWNAQMGLMLANGGPQTTQSSLMAKSNVNLRLIRQDDPAKMQEELVAFARALKNGDTQPTTGAHFVCIMGDGSASFLKGVNDVLRKLGPDYMAKVVGSCGYSRGEDKFMGPASWRDNPKAAMGGVACGYLRDGDWNIAQKWLGDNGLRNNPDEKTYDPDALNWVASNDYLDAAEKYITGYKETRPVVRNGKPTGETKEITVQSVVTWTPGDVNVAQKKGGLVKIVSTREYSTQMPNTIIGIDKWMKANRTTVEKMLDSIFKGGAMVRQSAEALTAASRISDKVYAEQGTGPEYWEKYYKGVIEPDAQGTNVELGGSAVNTLADNLVLFGLTSGTQNLFAATYTVFGNIVKDQYPELLPSFDPVEQVMDVSYVQNLARRSAPTSSEAEAALPHVEPATSSKPAKTISKKNWMIQFSTGSAQFTPSASAELQRMLRDLLIAGNTSIEVRGHTDNVGSPDKNMALSEQRAFAVKRWIEAKAPKLFPEGRIQVRALGQTQPLKENTTETGRALNRRVEIVISERG
ncbi:MAG: OmpA family protein [Armatimonadetes bacterium]|nr:OmpA family protein [Armatimonadota bacterium]